MLKSIFRVLSGVFLALRIKADVTWILERGEWSYVVCCTSPAAGSGTGVCVV